MDWAVCDFLARRRKGVTHTVCLQQLSGSAKVWVLYPIQAVAVLSAATDSGFDLLQTLVLVLLEAVPIMI